MGGIRSRARKNLGDSGERVAALFLRQCGYEILERNYRTRVGELDLVARDRDGIVFVEVRTRRGNAYGAPEETLTSKKRGKLVAMALHFLAANQEYADCAWRIDLVAIELDRNGRIARMEVIKNAVES